MKIYEVDELEEGVSQGDSYAAAISIVGSDIDADVIAVFVGQHLLQKR